MQKTIIVSLVAALAFTSAIIGGLLVDRQAPQKVVDQTLGEGTFNYFNKPATNTSVACGPTSATLLATSTSRIYAGFVVDGTSTVYISLGKPAVGSNGIRLNGGGGSYEITQDNMFTGTVACIASTTNTMVTVVSADQH